MRYWYRPDYWRWLWQERIRKETKMAIAVVGAVVLGVAGFEGANVVDAANQPQTFAVQRVVTVVRKVIRTNGADPKLVTTTEVVTVVSGTSRVVTVRRNGRTVVLRSPVKTVTVHGRVVAAPRPATVVRTVKVGGRLTTVTTRGSTVTMPGNTVTTPGATVTTPGKTVTTPGKTVTTPGET